MTRDRRGADGFVRLLRAFFSTYTCSAARADTASPYCLPDHLADFGQRLVGNAGRIGTHISNEADQAFFAQFHAFIQALRDHHGALHAEAQLAGRILLQLAGGKRRSSVAAAFFAIDRANQPIGLLHAARIFSASSPLPTSIFSSPLPTKRASKAGGLLAYKMCIDGPVFLFLERLDFALAFDDQTQRYGLHTSGGKTTANFVPQQR